MIQYSCINILNRSVKSFSNIITSLVNPSYNNVCTHLQEKMQKLHEHFLHSKHHRQITKYLVSNESGSWIEHMGLGEANQSHPSLSIILDSGIISPNRKIEHKPKSVLTVKRLLKTYIYNKKYCNPLFSEEIFEFMIDCSNYLAITHTLELEVSNETVYFKATPYSGQGTLSLVSRSYNAVMVKDQEALKELEQLGYVVDVENISTHH